MGFLTGNNNSNQPIVYLAVKYQALIQPLSEFIDGCQSIEVNDPTTGQKKIKYFRKFAGVEGNISKLTWYDTTLSSGKSLRGYRFYLNVDDADSPTGYTTAVLDLPFKSVAYNTFSKVAENIDPTKPITITVWVNKDQKAVVSFKQNGQALKYKYTRENMGECPEGKYNDVLNTWDFSEQLVFLKNRIDNIVVPRFNSNSENYTVDDTGYQSNPDEEGDTSFPNELLNLEY